MDMTKKMNKFKLGAITVAVCLILGLIIGFSGFTKIGVGNVGIVKHMNGKLTVLNQGIHFIGWGVSSQEYPTYMQSLILSDNVKEGGKDNSAWEVGTSDQQELPVNTNLTWKISIKNASGLYQSVGGKDISYVSQKIVETTLKNVVNKITHKYSWNQIKGSEQAKVTEEINKELSKELSKVGIEIGTFGFSKVGSPQGMAQSQQSLAQSELKIKQAQADQDRAKIENATKLLNAQTDAQVALTKAEGEAKANQVLSQSLTPNLIEYNKVQRWDGKNPTTVLGDGTSTLVTVK